MNTRDLSKFGHRERQMAAKLLTAIGTTNDTTKYLGDDVAVEFNPNSGNVFLVDGDFNVAMLNGDTLEDFIICGDCGHEEVASEFVQNVNDECCVKYCKDLGLVG